MFWVVTDYTWMAPRDRAADSDDDFSDEEDIELRILKICNAQTKLLWDILDSMDSCKILAVRFCAYYCEVEMFLLNQQPPVTNDQRHNIRNYLAELRARRWPNYQFNRTAREPLLRVHWRVEGSTTPRSVYEIPCGSIYQSYVDRGLMPN